MRHIIIYIYAFVAFSLLQACSNQSKPVAVDGDTIRLKYSTLLTMVRYSDHTDVTIADPWHKGKLCRLSALTTTSLIARR